MDVMNPISEEKFQWQGLPQHSHSARGKGSLLRLPNSGICQGILQMYHQQVDQKDSTKIQSRKLVLNKIIMKSNTLGWIRYKMTSFVFIRSPVNINGYEQARVLFLKY